MHSAGALAFSDDKAPLSTALLARALEYTKTFNGLIISFPLNHELNPGGLMHEGPTSTAMGTKGLSSTSEYMQVQRDLEILQYCGGRLHFSNISTAESVDLIRQAKKMGLPVTCGMAAHQLSFTDQDLMQFSSNLKTLPPFRQDADRQALIKGLLDDTIDVIVSDHSPAIIEDKAIEFEFASFGISALETAFCSIFTSTEGDVPIEKITAKLSVNPAEILGLECPIIEENSFANLTLFTTEDNTVFNQKNWKSKSSNSPFIGSTLRGKVLGTVC
jgi:dihydroorotase